ncbi:MAG: hypothetical protein U9N87_11460 [Planctomycetota bacterium]|nr:hypothetical protein [Planctomycetota bacterium]
MLLDNVSFEQLARFDRINVVGTSGSGILWAATSYHKNKKKYHALADSETYSHISFLRLNSTKSIDSCLKNLRYVERIG